MTCTDEGMLSMRSQNKPANHVKNITIWQNMIYYILPFDNYLLPLRQIINIMSAIIGRRQTVHITLITTYGLVHDKHSGKIQKVVTADDLFT